VLGATREIVEELAALQAKQSAETPTTAAAPAGKSTLLACPARDETDEVALYMLKELLDPSRYETRVISRTLLASEVVELVEEVEPALIVIAAPPPGGQSHTRLLLLRLRARFPNLAIVVGRWGLADDVDQKREQLLSAGANEFGLTLEETRRQIEALLQLDIAREANSTTALNEAAA
jgi:hypothetical protein